ncbi:glutamine-hydrolyzing GMP synthase [Fimbriimonadia bacterium ATM]|nr:MAG: glutamine-hydrolyzing GMP synthase [Armatimonadota bacterium]MBC6968905.1 glutamine-hydrolyzing GMP synthase [Armatimonadota bacterium]MCE7900034.1 glutamine-hydrolyzing GMP synthase [Armatimonadetes bacterium ATM1]MDL1929119.1 glutamine-hydrolyzing GMP synthase [Fimbriimonadia bacterium ATM]RIJ95079.1 MAG: GMP synthase (glutamine-hydrolyzing) [Armatimonadota bacterium]
MCETPTVHDFGSHEKLLVVDFGGQYTQLIARKVREQNVYAKIVAWDDPGLGEEWRSAKAVILSGGPKSVTDENAPTLDPHLLNNGLPVLGICYGQQLMAHLLGGRVHKVLHREYGRQLVKPSPKAALLASEGQVWMSHGDSVDAVPPGFEVVASTEGCSVAAIQNTEARKFGVQFHPEVTHTERGIEILRKFLFEQAKFAGDWTAGNFVEEAVASLREQVGEGKVLCGVSGGVDSTVAAALLAKAIGDRLLCVFVDHGLMRKNEAAQVVADFAAHIPAKLIAYDASQQFFDALSGVTDPEQKRKIIGAEFVRVFEQHADELKGCDFLAQGTLYPDVIESGSKTAETIKTHHNVGGLPDWMRLKLVEPLRWLFKDEVRAVGRELGLPKEMLEREPFPGPGLAVRIVGEVTRERVRIVQDADYIWREELYRAGLSAVPPSGYSGPQSPAVSPKAQVWQSYAALLDVQSVGVMGDSRTYAHPIVLRAVASEDAMTAHAVAVPFEVLDRAATRIVNEVKGVNRVLYDVTSKPPATIELE